MSRHHLSGHPDLREVAVPVATVWTAPDAARDVDRAAVADLPDMAAWTAELDAEGTPERRLGLHGRTLTQLLLGEAALVLEERGEWSRVVGLHQPSSAHEEGYPGWVRTAHLDLPVDRTEGATAFVTTPSTRLTRDDGLALDISCGTAWWTEGVTDARVEVLLPGGRSGTVPRADVRLSDKQDAPAYSPDDLLATARQFLGLRYLWGGTCAWGMDCSGLVHLVLRAHGRLVARDAFDQAVSPKVEPVALDSVVAGDLYFFQRPGEKIYHVGFATGAVEEDGSRRMLHAPEGGGLIEDAPMAPDRVEKLVSAGRVSPR